MKKLKYLILLGLLVAAVLVIPPRFSTFQALNDTDYWGGPVTLQFPKLCYNYSVPDRTFRSLFTLSQLRDFFQRAGLETTLFQPTWGCHSLLLQWENDAGGKTPYLIRQVPEQTGQFQLSALSACFIDPEEEDSTCVFLIPYHLLTTRLPVALYSGDAMILGEPYRTDAALSDFLAFYESTGYAQAELAGDQLTVFDGSSRFTIHFQAGESFSTVAFYPGSTAPGSVP